MLLYLRSLSAVCFYVLTATFFVAYLLLRNSVLGIWPAWWMQVADLPLIAVSLLYSGVSLYLSVQRPGKYSWMFPWVIALPLIILFAVLIVSNFWPEGTVLE